MTTLDAIREAHKRQRLRRKRRRFLLGIGVRAPAGEDAWNAKLTDHRVRVLRRAYAAGRSLKPLAKRYGVTYCAALYAARGDTWKHVQ